MGLLDINTTDYETIETTKETNKNTIPNNNSDIVIPSDRITHQIPKGVDHPSFFAKGTDINDSTPGGAYIPGTSTSTNIEEEDKDNEINPHTAWRAAKMDENGVFIEDDNNNNDKEDK